MANKRNRAKAVFSNHHDLGKVNELWTAKLLDDGSYEVVKNTGESRIFSDGEEFTVQMKSKTGEMRNRTYRVLVDGNKNLKFSQLMKRPLPNHSLNEATYSFKLGVNDVQMNIGDTIRGASDPNRIWTLELDAVAGPILVSEDSSFTVLVGQNILHGYYAKPSKHRSYTVYSTKGDGVLGRYKANSDGVETQPATIDDEQGKISFNHMGQTVMVPIRYKAFEKNLLVLNSTEQTSMGEAYQCFFNYIVPGEKNKGKDGIPGLFLPAKGNMPARFMEKGPNGELYNTASFFAGKTQKTANGLTRSIEDAKESYERYQDGRKINSLKEELLALEEDIKQITSDMAAIEVDPMENAEYVEKLPRLQYLRERIPLVSKEAQKEFNGMTFGKPESFRVVDGMDLFGANQQTSYNKRQESQLNN